MHVKFIYSEKATNFCEISTVDLSYVVTVKSTVEISQNFVAFSEYMNFKIACIVLWARVVGKLELQSQNPIPRREPKLLLPHNFIYFMQGPWDTLETVQST